MLKPNTTYRLKDSDVFLETSGSPPDKPHLISGNVFMGDTWVMMANWSIETGQFLPSGSPSDFDVVAEVEA